MLALGRSSETLKRVDQALERVPKPARRLVREQVSSTPRVVSAAQTLDSLVQWLGSPTERLDSVVRGPDSSSKGLVSVVQSFEWVSSSVVSVAQPLDQVAPGLVSVAEPLVRAVWGRDSVVEAAGSASAPVDSHRRSPG